MRCGHCDEHTIHAMLLLEAGRTQKFPPFTEKPRQRSPRLPLYICIYSQQPRATHYLYRGSHIQPPEKKAHSSTMRFMHAARADCMRRHAPNEPPTPASTKRKPNAIVVADHIRQGVSGLRYRTPSAAHGAAGRAAPASESCALSVLGSVFGEKTSGRLPQEHAAREPRAFPTQRATHNSRPLHDRAIPDRTPNSPLSRQPDDSCLNELIHLVSI